MGLVADWQTTFLVVLPIVFAVVAVVIVRMSWRFFRSDIEPEVGGSMGGQMFGRGTRAKKPEDWLNR